MQWAGDVRDLKVAGSSTDRKVSVALHETREQQKLNEAPVELMLLFPRKTLSRRSR